ncbi:unnamed protein product [Caenorhabditis angaria]|uniref:BTB domain-containing protein n=1 Tax=Caenorhabditis angaria TaxID=860376 RepID=A0A9P1MW21_9PELO|nr:unnamed protein product [Caenorhabditis angaria]
MHWNIESDAGLPQIPPRSPISNRSTVYTNEKMTGDFFQNLASMRLQKELCDVVIEAFTSPLNSPEDSRQDDLTIPQLIHAHRVVLSASSPYFRAMFTTGMRESATKQITMKEVDADVLSQIIDYMYTGRIVIDEQIVQTMLSTANLLQLICVRDACSRFLLEQLDVTNCLGIAAFARLHACSQLAHAAQLFTRQHFGDLIDNEELLNLDKASFIQLIADDRITTNGEEAVFEAVINWTHHDLVNRNKYLVEILKAVRLPLLPHKYLLNRVYYEPLIRQNKDCQEMLLSACKFLIEKSMNDISTTNAHRRPSLANSESDISEMILNCPQWLRPRQPVPLSQFVMIVGGQAPKAIANVDLFDPDSHLWNTCAPLPQRRCRSGVNICRELVYTTGGFNGAQRVKSVDVYDPRRDVWISGYPMEARRSTHGLAVNDGILYAVGGFDGSTGLCSAEMLDSRTGSWCPLPSMSTRRSSVGVTSLNGLIYAIGGFDGVSKQCLNTVEIYDQRANQWRSGPSLMNVRSGSGVTICDGKIVAVGGHRGADIHQSAEVLINDEWKELPNMTVGRRNASVVAVNDYLFAIGGDDGSSNLSTIECIQLTGTNSTYSDKSWQLIETQMPQGRSYAGIALLPKDEI